MDKQNIIQASNVILFSLKKEGNSETTQMNSEDILLSEKSQYKRQMLYDFTWVSRVVVVRKRESRIVVARG
jgi:hypothetical protein